MEDYTFEGMGYVVKYPANYKNGEKRPVIIFLHGAGSRGTDISIMNENPFFSITEKHENFPFILVAPQCSQNTWFDMFETLKKFTLMIINSDYADKDRIYVVGNSMGGYATWQLAMSMPECFAAIIPICGGGMYWNTARLANVPVWAFHGQLDPTVFVDESIKMVETVNKKGGNAKLTIYPDAKHDSWTETYNNYEVFEWLLSHSIKNTDTVTEDFADSKKFG